MRTAPRSIRQEHVEAFIAAELKRTAPSFGATRYRSLQQVFGWLDEEGEINESPMAKTRPPKIPREAGTGSARRGFVSFSHLNRSPAGLARAGRGAVPRSRLP